MRHRRVGRLPEPRPSAVTAVVVATAIALLLSAAAPAGAHALRVSSSPDAGAVLDTSPSVVTVTFGERPDAHLSRLRVLDSAGHDETAGATGTVAGQPRALEVHVKTLGRGVYTVAWTTVSAVDGHAASGTFAFGVRVAPTGAAATMGTSTTSAPSSTSVGRWLFYVGLMLLVGGAAVGLTCFERPPRLSWPALSVTAWCLAFVGALTIAMGEVSAAHVPAGQLWSSSFRVQLEDRLGPLLIAAGLLIAPPLRRPRRALALLGGAGLVAMWGDVRLSHAAAATRESWIKMLEQWFHFVAAGVWIGGLATLLVGLASLAPDGRRRAARRFSAIALAAVVVLAGSGGLRAIDEVGSWHALTATTFGQAILVKSGLLAVLVVLGAVNRYRSVPAVERDSRSLVTVGRVELGLAALVLVATAVLQGQAPPSSVAAASGPPPVVATGHDFAETVAVRLTVSPGTVGFNQFAARVADYDTGRPLRADVTLSFSLPARPDLGASSLPLHRSTDGTYRGTGANLSIDGTWEVDMLIQQTSGAAQIPLHVTTRPTPEHITVDRSPGVPDLYTIALADSASLQVYLDPGTTGFNEFHATYIGADGKEMPMHSLSVTVTRPGPTTARSPDELTVRRLDSIGHFVADLAGTRSGRYRFVLDGVSGAGTTYRSDVTVPVP